MATTTITLESQIARTLEEQAAARNLPLDSYLRALAENSQRILGPTNGSPHDLSQSDFVKWLGELSAGMPPIPPLPADFSRADIYNDHD